MNARPRRFPHWAASVAGAAAVGVLGWWLWPRSPDQIGPATGAATNDVPVIIYLIDTLRADRLGLYGYSRRPVSPEIDALAAESVVFDEAYGAAPWTLPSVASLHTSTFACEHGLNAYGRKLNPAIPTLAEALSASGYATAGYFSNIHAGALAGLDRGFATAEERPTRDNDRSQDASAFLQGVGNRPFFLYLHTMEPHEPFHTPAGIISQLGHVSVDDRETFRAIWLKLNELRSTDWSAGRPVGTTDNSREQAQILRYLDDHREGYELLYDAAVRYADENVGRIIALLRQTGIWDRAIFILLADHGEEFGEHGSWLHGQSVYEEQLRVPLLVHFPGSAHAGKRVQGPVSLVDVMPTVLDYLGRGDRCVACRGRSLLPAVDGSAGAGAPVDAYIPAVRMNEIHYYRPAHERQGNINVAIRRGEWKGIWNVQPETLELFDLANDSQESSDALNVATAPTAALRAAATAWLDTCRATSRSAVGDGALDTSERDKLRALGYIR